MAVILANGSLGTASATTITGLTTGKKYKVTTLGFTYPLNANGTLGTPGAPVTYSALSALSGTSITGLTDGQVYLVQEVTGSGGSPEGVNPVNTIVFGVNISGRTGNTSTTVTNTEALNISFENGMQEWTPMESEGWSKALMTSKKIKISFTSKRNYGDAGNDYIASLADKNGQDCNSIVYVTFPDGSMLTIPCVINVISLGGNSTDVISMSWEITSDGKPTFAA